MAEKGKATNLFYTSFYCAIVFEVYCSNFTITFVIIFFKFTDTVNWCIVQCAYYSYNVNSRKFSHRRKVVIFGSLFYKYSQIQICVLVPICRLVCSQSRLKHFDPLKALRIMCGMGLRFKL